MENKKKFIKTTDEKTAKQLLVAGFRQVSQIGSVYTFVNEIPERFNFDVIDKKMIVFDNKLSL